MQAAPVAPSFAAAPLLGIKRPQQPSEPPRRNPILATAKQVAEQAAKTHAVSPATASNPLYRFAKLASAAQGEARHGQGRSEKQGGAKDLHALKDYAALSQQQKPVAATVRSSVKKALDARTLLRYARLK